MSQPIRKKRPCADKGKGTEKWKKRRQLQNSGSLRWLKGSKGFLLTTDMGRERQAGHEACDLLTEYLEDLYPCAGASAHTPATVMDASDMIAAELAKLQSSRPLLHLEDISSRGLAYIRFAEQSEEVDPVDIVAAYIRDLATPGKVRQLRHCVRMMPLQCTCNASIADVVAAAKPMIERAFVGLDDDVSFALNIKRRSCSLDRDEVIKAVTALVPRGRKVNLKSPGLVILVECLRSLVGISIVSNYARVAKFNVRQVAAVASESCSVKTKEAEDQTTARGGEKVRQRISGASE